MKAAYKWRIENGLYAYITDETDNGLFVYDMYKHEREYGDGTVVPGSSVNDSAISTVVSKLTKEQYIAHFNLFKDFINSEYPEVSLLDVSYYYNIENDECSASANSLKCSGTDLIFDATAVTGDTLSVTVTNEQTDPSTGEELRYKLDFVFPIDGANHRPVKVDNQDWLGNNTTPLNLSAGTNITLTKRTNGTVIIEAAGGTDTWRQVKVDGNPFLTDTSTPLNLSGGTNVTLTTGANGTVMIEAQDTPDTWRQVKVDGNPFLTDTSTPLNLSAGTNITLTTGANGTVMIEADGGSSTDEKVEQSSSNQNYTYPILASEKKTTEIGNGCYKAIYDTGMKINPYKHSMAEGSSTATGEYSHAEGKNTSTTASGKYSHAEGLGTNADNDAAHAEGSGTTASGIYSHSEGKETTASGKYSHAEGLGTNADNDAAHAEGSGTTASGKYSHAGGYYTTADKDNMTAIGKCNKTGIDNCLFAVGDGDGTSTWENALTVKGNSTDSTTATVNGVRDVQLGMPIGTITMWAGSSAPSGWLLCNGNRILTQNNNSIVQTIQSKEFKLAELNRLISVISSTYGTFTTIKSESNGYIKELNTLTPVCDVKYWTNNQQEAYCFYTIPSTITYSNQTVTDTTTYYSLCLPNLQQRFPIGSLENGTIGKNGHASDSPGWSTNIGTSGGESINTLSSSEMPTHRHNLLPKPNYSSKTFVGHEASSTNKGSYLPLSTTLSGSLWVQTDDVGDSNSHNNIPPYLAINFIIKYT